jgi:phosphoglycolate phosphatase-like HAD superfamily hydrolase
MTDIQTRYDAIVFDNDGVIVEPTARSHLVDAVLEAFREFGHEPDREYAAETVATAAGPHDTVGDYDIDIEAFWEHREDAAAAAQKAATRDGGKRPYDDVTVLERFDVPLGLVSNNQAETVAFLLDYYDLPDFETAYGRAHSVEGASRRKPEPYYIDQALRDLETTDALYVGDSEKDVVAAHRAGVDSAFLRREHVRDTRLNVEPTYEVSDLHELAGAITAEGADSHVTGAE